MRAEQRGDYVVLVNDLTGEHEVIGGPGVPNPRVLVRVEPPRPAASRAAPSAPAPSYAAGDGPRRESDDGPRRVFDGPRPPSEAWYAAHYPRCGECGRSISPTTCFNAYNGSRRAGFCSERCGNAFIARENG